MSLKLPTVFAAIAFFSSSASALKSAETPQERAKPTAQSTSNWNRLPYRAIDGQSDKPFMAWTSLPFGGGSNADPKDVWWMLELPHPIRVQGVKVIGDTRGGIPILKNFRIEYRESGKWKTAGEMRDAQSNEVTVSWPSPVETDALRIFVAALDVPGEVRLVEFLPILADGGEKTIPQILGLTPYQASIPYPGPEFPSAVAAGLPQFKLQGVVLDYKDLKYNPCDDAIFPSVIRTDKLQNPLGKYYMYYAPHNGPGGICLAYADSLEGPWKEYEANPLIKKDWEPNYSVSHVSSPDAIWIEEEKKLFLFFHGENDTTRFASTTDGIHFNYEGVSWTDKLFNGEVGQATYARVYRYTIPGKDNRYIAIFMGDHHGKARKVFFATSKDARSWDVRKEPLVEPPEGTNQIAGNWYLPWKGKHYIIYHGHWSVNNIVADLHVSEVDPGFEHSTYVGLLFDHKEAGIWNEAMMGPCIFKENGKLYMFVNTGPRLHQRIALAVASGEDTTPDKTKP